jgi:large subunit ribosomal protein L25
MSIISVIMLIKKGVSMTVEKLSLELTERKVSGKKVSSLRRDGIVPGVVYGSGFEPVSVQASINDVTKVVVEAGKNRPVHIDVAGKKRVALVKDVSRDPVKNLIRHVSFHAVKSSEKVVAEVPVHLVGIGESLAEKAGLVILQTLEKLDVRALPLHLPEVIDVDVRKLAEAHQQVTVADIKLPEDIELAYSEDISGLVIASVYEPSALQAANEASGGDSEGEVSEVEAEKGSEAEQAKV